MIRLFPVRAALLVGAVGLSAISCQDSTAPRVPAEVTIVAPPAKVASDGALVLVIQDLIPLEAEVLDQAGNPMQGQTVEWSSSDQSVVSITSQGLVTALGVGSATITAKAGDATTTLPVRVTLVPVASVTVSGPSSLLVGESAQATATVSDANGHIVINRAVTWSTDHPEVATVNDAGLIVATGPGSATITATSEGKSGTLGVTTTLTPVASVSIQFPGNVTFDGERVHLFLPDTTEMRVVLRDANGNQLANRPITFSVDAPGVLDVAPSGVVVSKGFGYATVTATAEGMSASANFVVQPSGVRILHLKGGNAEVVGTEIDTVVTGVPETYAISVLDRAGNSYQPDSLAWSFSRAYGSGGTITMPAHVVNSPIPGTLAVEVNTDKVGNTAFLLGAYKGGVSAGGVVRLASAPAYITTASDTITVASGGAGVHSFEVVGNMFDANGNAVNTIVGLDDIGWSSADPAIASVLGTGAVGSIVRAIGDAHIPGTTQFTADMFGTHKTVTVVVTP